HRAFAGLAVIDGDDAPAIDAPRHLVLVLTGGDASVALDAAVGVAEKFHPSHDLCPPSSCSDLAERGFGLLHSGEWVVAVGRDRFHALADHDRIGALGIFVALIDALEPAGKVEGHPGHPLADAFGDQHLHAAGLAARHFGTRDPDPGAVL